LSILMSIWFGLVSAVFLLVKTGWFNLEIVFLSTGWSTLGFRIKNLLDSNDFLSDSSKLINNLSLLFIQFFVTGFSNYVHIYPSYFYISSHSFFFLNILLKLHLKVYLFPFITLNLENSHHFLFSLLFLLIKLDSVNSPYFLFISHTFKNSLISYTLSLKPLSLFTISVITN
jgi:hypothetical protein